MLMQKEPLLDDMEKSAPKSKTLGVEMTNLDTDIEEGRTHRGGV